MIGNGMVSLIGIQARSTSTRLPCKVLAPIVGCLTVLDCVYDSCIVDGCKTVILCPEGDLPVIGWCKSRGARYLEGSETDVLSRYVDAAEHFGAKWVVRITSDCPLLPTCQLSYMMDRAMSYGVDFATNLPTIDGWDIDILSREALSILDQATVGQPYHREHVTSYFHQHPGVLGDLGLSFWRYALTLPKEWSGTKLSVDTKDDLQRVRDVVRGAA